MIERLLKVFISVFLGIMLTGLAGTWGFGHTESPTACLVTATELPDSAATQQATAAIDTQEYITVPYRYQGEEDGRSDTQQAIDCGQTCVAMAIQYATEQTITVKAIHDYIGREGLTSADHLMRALDHWHIEYESIDNSDALTRAVQAGNPVIVVFDAGEIPKAEDYCATAATAPSQHFNRFHDYAGGHWAVVTGISSDGNWVIVNDPNVWGSPPYHKYWYSDGTPKGATRYFSAPHFISAFNAMNEEALVITTPPYVSRLDAQVVNQPPLLVLSPGETKDISFDLQNTSAITLWANRTNLSLLQDQKDSVLITPSDHRLENDIPPGYQMHWEITITAPQALGLRNLKWQLRFNGAPFGPVLGSRILVRPTPDDLDILPDETESEDPQELVDAWLESLVADIEAQGKAELDRLRRRIEASLLERLTHILVLLAETWKALFDQCFSASALLPLTLLLAVGTRRRRS